MAQSILCTIASCDKKHFGHGFCIAHYKKWRRWGDPLGGKAYREARTWLENVAAHYTGDDCLAFPYFVAKDGYGRINVDGSSVGAHAFVLELVDGPKPTPKHECCHSCGKGHEACVTPKHMYWGTRKENTEDARKHGTLGLGYRVRGESHHNNKLSDNDVAEILKGLAAGELQQDIAVKYGISQAHVSRIKLKQSRNKWRNASGK